MKTKHLDRFSILIAIVVSALTISIMSLTSRMERENDNQQEEEAASLTFEADSTIATPADSTAVQPLADSLSVLAE